MTTKQEIIARIVFWVSFAIVAYVYIDQSLNILANQGYDMTQQKIRSSFESGELTWGDLLEITGLPAHVLYAILNDLIQGHDMTTTIKFMTLHSQSKAESIARECMRDDHGWQYVAIQWGPKYWVVEISDEDGVIGYL